MFETFELVSNYTELQSIARRIRKNIIKMISQAGSGHPGGSLSCVEILTALYFKVLRLNPDYPEDMDRDRFVLSKGHAAPALYATLAEFGFIPKEWLNSLRKFGSPLQGHPDMKKVPGVEISTGSLGQGLSVGVGMALGAKIQKLGYRVFVLLGDGECQEGQVWEAAMAASHYKLNNLIAIVDRNRLQIDGNTEDVMSLEPFVEKWKAFGWMTLEVNGHDFGEIIPAFQIIPYISKPLAIIANTVKGKGVSFMENNVDWHGKAPKDEETEKALEELEEKVCELV
ncbi:transketolase [Thermodesulfovibrio sp. TK110]